MGVLWCREHGGGTKTMHAEDKTGRAGPDLGPMAGEISPNIMFCKSTKAKARDTRTAPDGCTWVRMGAVVCICTGGQEKKGKRGKIRWPGHILQVCPRTTKTARIMLDSFCKKKNGKRATITQHMNQGPPKSCRQSKQK